MLELGAATCLYVRAEITRYKPATKYLMISHKPVLSFSKRGNFKNMIANIELSCRK